MQISYDISYINPIVGNGIICREQIKKGTIIWFSNQVSYDEISHLPLSNASDNLFSHVNKIKKYAHINVITFNQTNFEPFLQTLLSKDVLTRFLDLSYGVSDEIHYIMDDGKFINHSSNPNCYTNMEDASMVALRDIEKEEMLTEDYSTYTHPNYLRSVYKKYDCKPDFYFY